MELVNLAILFRVINLYTHHAHNMVKGQTFFEDHEFFADLYEKADGFYDDIIERYIGTTGGDIKLTHILSEAYKVIAKADDDYFKTTQIFVEHAVKKLDAAVKMNFSEGTKNLLQGMSDDLEKTIYKLKRKNI